ncbi:Phosphoglycerate dehydrogenase [Halogranum amylolyticum]|uniref:Phosphoglycerate dehydrogenase n=1 Tax=Halogranum amylolyticum TaxID=660520 RepID=A0A1H8NI86_9EURY|nr:D-2-hydroxyacid dehydrogenase [Halogranum amylolyticum]SEO29304.1 Phosphoglycerate dehydrogenase [Halogranum amylolyticum]
MSDGLRLLIPHHVSPDRTDDLLSALEGVVPAEHVVVADTPTESFEHAEAVEGIVTYDLDDDLLAAATNLRWIQCLSAGVDHYDLEALREREIVLTNSSGIHAEPIAEQTLCYLLMFERGLVQATRQQGRGVWERFEGGELRGKTLGVVGVGSIGTRVAELGAALGMTVVGTKRDTSERPAAVDELFAADDYHEVLRRSDYVVLAVPLTEETRGLLGGEELRLMSSDTVLVNVARGDVVDEAALTAALQNRSIRGAALDVFETEPLSADSPLWDLSNVVVTPHMAGSTPKKPERWRELLRQNYEALDAGDLEAMVNRVV